MNSREIRTAPLALLLTFVDICRLRRGPQDVPASRELFGLTVVGYTLSGIGSLAIGWPFKTALAAGVGETALLAAITYTVLFLRGAGSRWLQTITALAGTGLLFTLVSAPLFYSRSHLLIGSDVRSAIDLLMLLVFIWNVAVIAHILRHALSTSYAGAILLAIGLVWLTAAVLEPLFPETAVY